MKKSEKFWMLFLGLINACAAGGTAYYLIWAPANLPVWLAILIGVPLGFLSAWFWWHSLHVDDEKRKLKGHRLRLILLAFSLLMAIGIGTAALIQIVTFQKMLGEEHSKAEQFDHFFAAVEHAYPYFDEKGIDSADLYARYAPEIAAAADSSTFYDTIGRMLGELGDGHTDLRGFLDDECCQYSLAELIEEQITVTAAGEQANSFGMAVGDVITSVNGAAINDYLAEICRYGCGSSPQQRAYWGADRVMRIPLNASITYTALKPDGKQADITMNCPPEDEETDAAHPNVTSELLDSDYGYIKVRSLSDGACESFNAALDEFMDAPGLMLDLRGNGGGNSLIGDCIAGRFLEEAVFHGKETYCFPYVLHAFFWESSYAVFPQGETYTHPLVVLIDAGSASSTEMMIAGLLQRAVLVGRQTAGSSGNPITYTFADGMEARYSSGAFYLSDGTLLEGAGIAPNIPVAITIDSLVEGVDLDIAAAETALDGLTDQ